MKKEDTKYNIIVPANMNPRPRPHEESAAAILAIYFKSNVYFIVKGNLSTADVKIRNLEWEIKSPEGNSKNCILRNLREASHQAENVVMDLRRTKLHINRSLGYIRQFLERPHKIKRVLVITKSEKILVIK